MLTETEDLFAKLTSEGKVVSIPPRWFSDEFCLVELPVLYVQAVTSVMVQHVQEAYIHIVPNELPTSHSLVDYTKPWPQSFRTLPLIYMERWLDYVLDRYRNLIISRVNDVVREKRPVCLESVVPCTIAHKFHERIRRRPWERTLQVLLRQYSKYGAASKPPPGIFDSLRIKEEEEETGGEKARSVAQRDFDTSVGLYMWDQITKGETKAIDFFWREPRCVTTETTLTDDRLSLTASALADRRRPTVEKEKTSSDLLENLEKTVSDIQQSAIGVVAASWRKRTRRGKERKAGETSSTAPKQKKSSRRQLFMERQEPQRTLPAPPPLTLPLKKRLVHVLPFENDEATPTKDVEHADLFLTGVAYDERVHGFVTSAKIVYGPYTASGWPTFSVRTYIKPQLGARLQIAGHGIATDTLASDANKFIELGFLEGGFLSDAIKDADKVLRELDRFWTRRVCNVCPDAKYEACVDLATLQLRNRPFNIADTGLVVGKVVHGRDRRFAVVAVMFPECGPRLLMGTFAVTPGVFTPPRPVLSPRVGHIVQLAFDQVSLLLYHWPTVARTMGELTKLYVDRANVRMTEANN